MYLLDRAVRDVVTSNPTIGIATTGDANWPIWNRYITIFGERAFDIGNICGTCAYLFKRLEHAANVVDVPRLTDRLAAGVASLEPDVIDDFAALLPSSAYQVALLEIAPHQVFPGSVDDYFAHEQVANEETYADREWGLPHYPRVAYYRPKGRANLPVAGDEQLFEFVVPMSPLTQLDFDRVRHYEKAIGDGARPTAVALSILDIKGPAERGVRHWCLTHFLLDGHHKMCAAARQGRPLTLIAFIGVDHGVSTAAEIETVLKTPGP